MFDVACRPMGRLFYWLLPMALLSTWSYSQTPALTTINDIVYRADGTPAGGTLLISWPEFSTAGGQAVAVGENSVVLGSGGAVSVQLVPNIGATPTGTFYTVVYQLNDNTVKTEFWIVSTTSPTTIAAIRTTPDPLRCYRSSPLNNMSTRQSQRKRMTRPLYICREVKLSPNAATVLASGVNIENILSQGMVPYFQNLTDQQFVNRFQAMVFKSGVWGVPIGIFWHWNELTPTQVGMMLDALKSSGATLMTNTQLVNYLQGTQQNPGTTYYADSSSGKDIDVRPTQISPVVDQGAALATEYKYDLMGIDQTSFGSGWEIGAFAMVPERLGPVR
jgi:hypothetical protein